MYLYPTICIDNFYENPDEVVDFANSLEYKKGDGAWPGKRTDQLHLIDSHFFYKFSLKFLSIFHDTRKERINWDVSTSFQKINPNEFDDGLREGFVHTDDSMIYTAVIYLSKNIDKNCGTSICHPKKFFSSGTDQEIRKEMYLNYNKNNYSEYKKQLIQNNDCFEESVIFKQRYNRLIGFDSMNYHKADSYGSENSEPRLTQVVFIRKVTAEWFPIPNMRRIVI